MPYKDKEKNKAYQKAYQKEYKKKYNIKNKQKVKEYKREYNAKNRQKINERRRKYRNKEIDKICIICEKNFILKSNQSVQTKCCSIECRKQNQRNFTASYNLKKRVPGSDYYKKHLEYNKKYLSAYNKLESTKLKKYNKNDPIQKAKEIKRVNIYVSKRRKIDKLFNLKLILRNQLGRVLNKKQKAKNNIKVLDLLGCSIKYLKEHLEKKFKPGMSWDNYGNLGWHIDHIKPLSLAKSAEDIVKGKFFHYTNLQPLWAEENIKKSNKYEIILDEKI